MNPCEDVRIDNLGLDIVQHMKRLLQPPPKNVDLAKQDIVVVAQDESQRVVFLRGEGMLPVAKRPSRTY
eukprot:m.38896 g.38896  ORF g.38896 m.38896 type:complete len:69 (-) comp9489_c0_seq2:298-504(-)